MLSVPEAQAIVLRHAAPLPPAPQRLSPSLLGLILAEDVASDIDAPPFDKAMMDGYAVRSDDLKSGRGVLKVVEEVLAGQTPRVAVRAGEATRIMTGAPIPGGADAVVMVERTKSIGDFQVEIADTAKPGQNVLPRGREMRSGDVVLKVGTRLRPQEFGLLASVGQTMARVQPRPKVAILATGDELVEPEIKPGPGQIRNSNAWMLAAQTSRAGAEPQILEIARDDVPHLRKLALQGLAADVLVLSGGVSAGKVDLAPAVLQELGVEAHFHKVAMKPGKPIFFGTKANGDRPLTPSPSPPGGEGKGVRGETLVFGLPGNPVSSLVCFELFVRPALARLQGVSDTGARVVRAELAEDFAYRTDRPTWHPAVLSAADVKMSVRAVTWFGSADLRGLLTANAFVVFPAGDHVHRAGQVFEVLQVE